MFAKLFFNTFDRFRFTCTLEQEHKYQSLASITMEGEANRASLYPFNR